MRLVKDIRTGEEVIVSLEGIDEYSAVGDGTILKQYGKDLKVLASSPGETMISLQHKWKVTHITIKISG